MKVFQKIFSRSVAIENCQISGNTDWEAKHTAELDSVIKTLPSGGGFDNGCELVSVSNREIVIRTSFHHMDSDGFYDGRTNHTIRVKPSFDIMGFEITVTGQNKNDIKDYILDVFYSVLGSDVP